ncbi:MAG: TetR family transcriptional regulator [Micrococcales bacterium 70-64]|nr:TetR/AcrR family transcriptional regulator [Leifsonia sp.]ODU63210.1 MAG: TetR family transcriptional regulator [Leifsonia sp. SCN 70-46]OJX84901.1 MAG: TetR family transcriptional regulator [Micrococcales bacterium 70-64]
MPKLIDHDQRREHIIDVTWALIVEGGIEAATMREIAAKAGFANGALKHYFPSKAKIVEGTFDRAMRIVGAGLNTEQGRGLAGLRALSIAAIPRDEAAVTAGRVLMAYWEMSLANEEMRDRYEAFLADWRGLILRYLAEGRADGDIVTATPDEVLVDELVLLTAGANIMTLVGRRFTTLELVERHLDDFLGRLERR